MSPPSLIAAKLNVTRATALRALGRVHEAWVDVYEALRLANEVHDARLLAHVHSAAQELAIWDGDGDRAEIHGAAALAHAESSEDEAVQWSAHSTMALLAAFRGDARTAHSHLGCAQALARMLGSPVMWLDTEEIAIEVAHGTGKWDDALRCVAHATVVARKLGLERPLARILAWGAMIDATRGDTLRARRSIGEARALIGLGDPARELQHPMDAVAVYTADAALHLADREVARGAQRSPAGASSLLEVLGIGTRALALADQMGHFAWAGHWLPALVGQAHLWLGVHDPAHFDEALLLAARTRRHAQSMRHHFGITWADACEALVMVFRDGNYTEGASRLAHAVTEFASVPLPEYAACAQRELAWTLSRMGRTNEAIHEARAAHDTFRALGAERGLDARLTVILLEEMNAAPRASSAVGTQDDSAEPLQRSTSPKSRSARTREVRDLLRLRLTDKEIAARLGLSRRTVEWHVANVLRAAGVSTRRDLI